jgi:hypothetical protein
LVLDFSDILYDDDDVVVVVVVVVAVAAVLIFSFGEELIMC